MHTITRRELFFLKFECCRVIYGPQTRKKNCCIVFSCNPEQCMLIKKRTNAEESKTYIFLTQATGYKMVGHRGTIRTSDKDLLWYVVLVDTFATQITGNFLQGDYSLNLNSSCNNNNATIVFTLTINHTSAERHLAEKNATNF